MDRKLVFCLLAAIAIVQLGSCFDAIINEPDDIVVIQEDDPSASLTCTRPDDDDFVERQRWLFLPYNRDADVANNWMRVDQDTSKWQTVENGRDLTLTVTRVTMDPDNLHTTAGTYRCEVSNSLGGENLVADRRIDAIGHPECGVATWSTTRGIEGQFRCQVPTSSGDSVDSSHWTFEFETDTSEGEGQSFIQTESVPCLSPATITANYIRRPISDKSSAAFVQDFKCVATYQGQRPLTCETGSAVMLQAPLALILAVLSTITIFIFT